MKLWNVWSILLLAFVACLGTIAHAQNAQGSILGHVTDASGASVAGAVVTLTSTDTSVARTYTTTSTGDYQFLALNPGRYSLSADMTGFQKQLASNLTLEVNQTLRQNFAMAVGSVSQEVSVSTETQLLHTDDATLGTVVSAELMSQLPLNGRDFTNLLQISVGASTVPGGIQTTGYVLHGLNPSFQEVSINGARADSIAYSVDGITIRIISSADLQTSLPNCRSRSSKARTDCMARSLARDRLRSMCPSSLAQTNCTVLRTSFIAAAYFNRTVSPSLPLTH